uniref:Uncharacterized protein n=1 Tax=Cacopsylla melanoneura TaxID=428564 RepID=A0A8D9DX32_9HEMI
MGLNERLLASSTSWYLGKQTPRPGLLASSRLARLIVEHISQCLVNIKRGDETLRVDRERSVSVGIFRLEPGREYEREEGETFFEFALLCVAYVGEPVPMITHHNKQCIVEQSSQMERFQPLGEVIICQADQIEVVVRVFGVKHETKLGLRRVDGIEVARVVHHDPVSWHILQTELVLLLLTERVSEKRR